MSEPAAQDAIERGHVARRSGRFEEALAQYRRAVALAPQLAATQSVCGLMLLQMERVAEAAPYLEYAAALAGDDPDVGFNLAELRARQDRLPEAMEDLARLALRFPRVARYRERLGEWAVQSGQFAAAAEHFRVVAERHPHDPAAWFRWARATFDAGDPRGALPIIEQAAKLAPRHAAILGLRAEIAQALGDWPALAAAAQTWTRQHPGDADAWRMAATAQWQQGLLVDAMASYRSCLALQTPSAADLATYGRLCLTAQANDEATKALDAAAQLDPDHAPVLSAQATLAVFKGGFETALAYARRALVIDPTDAAAWKVLVQLTHGHPAAEERAALEDLVSRQVAPSGADARITALFALADCQDADKDTAAAFATYAAANQAARDRGKAEGLGYDRAARRQEVDAIIAMASSAPPTVAPGLALTLTNSPSTPHGSGYDQPTRPIPVFIVGLPRSGSTLVENILAAHSTVAACGERQAMRAIMQEFTAIAPHRGVAGLPRTTVRRWRDAYWRGIAVKPGHTPAAVTDKNPWNFDALPLIFQLFPEARVVHVRRHPVETGLSIYRNEFPKFAAFSLDLADIGHYIGEYARLINHWERVLPGRFLTMSYEALVEDPATTTRELLRFCGLEWEDACLSPAAGRRDINTMSAVQVRSPIVRSSSRRLAYAQHLEPLRAALRDAGVDPETGLLQT